MSYAIVFRLLSYILFCEAALLLLPATASLCYGEWSVLGVFVLTAALCLVLGCCCGGSSLPARCSTCGKVLPPRP